MERALALPAHAVIVDVACGRGRHAIPLARRGHVVVALDIVLRAVRVASDAGARGVVADTDAMPIRDESVDAILCVNYLDRALVPRLASLLRPGGALILETFTTDQRRLGQGPTSAAHLLEPGELPRLVAPLVVVESREGLVSDDSGERYAASVLAVKGRPAL